MTELTEQPNKELLIAKTIQGLISAVNRELGELSLITASKYLEIDIKLRYSLITKALEEIDLFEKTTLFELQKAFE